MGLRWCNLSYERSDKKPKRLLLDLLNVSTIILNYLPFKARMLSIFYWTNVTACIQAIGKTESYVCSIIYLPLPSLITLYLSIWIYCVTIIVFSACYTSSNHEVQQRKRKTFQFKLFIKFFVEITAILVCVQQTISQQIVWEGDWKKK